MTPTALRALITGIVGVLTALGIIPESASALIEENAALVVGGVLVIWGAFAADRARKDRAKP